MKARRFVGWNLRRIRVAQGFSIESLAGEAEVDESHLARIERGTVNSSVDVLERLVHALDAKLAELFVEPEPGASPPKPLRSGRKARKRR
jgi:transcriptional regulator with XRE-family HTH domain